MNTPESPQAKRLARLLLVMSYAVLAAAFTWAARQTGDGFETWVFLGCIALSWLPAYVYASRREIAAQPGFWISHAVAGSAGLVLFLSYAWADGWISSHRRSRDGASILVLLAATILGPQIFLGTTACVMRKIQASLERRLEQRRR